MVTAPVTSRHRLEAVLTSVFVVPTLVPEPGATRSATTPWAGTEADRAPVVVETQFDHRLVTW